MAVVRWRLQEVETGDAYLMELNPNQMGNYVFPKSFEFALYGGSRMRGIRGAREPMEWTFGGVIRTKTHHDALIHWQHTKPGKVRVTDHLGRTFEVMIRSLDLKDRRPAGNDTWRFQYTFNCLLLRRIT